MPQTFAPFARPLYMMAKPAGSRCNMACAYCYYLEKAHLYGQDAVHDMDDALLEKFIKDYIAAQTMPEVLFTWHGGETLLRDLNFYRKVVRLQRRYAAGHVIDNCLQTNGMLLTPEWCRFFKDNGWLVGISIDGPREVHDAYRRNRGGKPSFDRVMRGIELLDRHGVMWNALAVVNNLNGDDPAGFYRFFKDIGCQYLQFTPVVERLLAHDDGRQLASPAECDGARMAPFSVRPEQWGSFLCGLFDEWIKEDVGSIFVQLFDATLANWVGQQPGICTLARTCGHAGVMEYNGDVYSCDHFVFPAYRLGNLRHDSLVNMMYGPRQTQFGRDKHDRLPSQCKACPWEFACHGECPRNRFATTADGEPGLNYLCAGYRQFFAHVAPYMDFMKRELQHQRPPANVMQAVRDGRL